ncbi:MULTISPECIES: MrpH family fimbial adhesin [unclassified Serratia (in: enterobacteria)]|uniref:MrpH family fimbial adhesin n=1 Tax=unclassified Serratia (in: enterobacteria) TaxID=2647522 RepID=UPI003FA73B13
MRIPRAVPIVVFFGVMSSIIPVHAIQLYNGGLTNWSYNPSTYTYSGTVHWASDNSPAPSGTVSCGGFSRCRLGIGVYFSYSIPGYSSGWYLEPQPYVLVPAGSTWEFAYEKYISTYGASGQSRFTTSTFRNGTFLQVCLIASGLSYSNTAVRAPGSTCGVTPPYANSCDVTSGSSVINHGALAPSEVNGHTAQTSFSISCRSRATIRVNTISPKISLGSNVNSSLQVNGLSAGGRFTVAGGVTTHIVSSTLESSRPVAGPLRGTGVIIMTYE